MYFYIFGSACRGELDRHSDIDMLAIYSEEEDISHLDANKLSIYREKKIQDLWGIGNPFAWHLYHESKLTYSSNGTDFLKKLGEPSTYSQGLADCLKFYDILIRSSDSLKEDKFSLVFDLSTIFLCMRNIATCYTLHIKRPNFSRDAAILLEQCPLEIDSKIYNILKNCRLANTRGIDILLENSEVELVIDNLPKIKIWANKLIEMLKNDPF